MLGKESKNHKELQRYLNYDFLIKNNMLLFSFSQLKSKTKMTINENNSFKILFSDKNDKPEKEKKNLDKINNRKICLLDGESNNSLKTLNIEVPSSEKLLQKKFQNEFMSDYDNSFSYFCGINKNQFREIYINNRYMPILNELGDISISIKSIINILKTFSYSLKMKIHRRFKKNRVNKIFKTFKNKSLKENKFIFDIKNINENNKIPCIEEKENNNLEENHQNLNEDYGINNLKNNKMLNLKKRLKISIQKDNNNNNLKLKQENFLNRQNFKRKNNNITMNNNFMNNEMEVVYSNNIPKPSIFNYNKQVNAHSSNNNIFNFSTKDVQNYFNSENNNRKDFLNKKRANSNYFNNNYNYNIPFNNQILSPLIYSPNINILSPSSYQFSFSNLSSPNLFAFSPYYNNNNIINDRFTFNNATRNSFTFGNNSPIIINNNINTTYNNIINNNIINNKNEVILNNNISDFNNNKNINIKNNINNNINPNVNNNKNNNLNNNLNNNINSNININNIINPNLQTTLYSNKK